MTRERWTLVILGIGLAVLWAAIAHAAEMCDMQGRCYPGQVYHGDLAHPDRETGPPVYNAPPRPLAPTYRPAQIGPEIAQNRCHIVLERREGEPNFQALEVCTLSPEREDQIRREMGL
jgi:hypothetical protein